jgi:hypothetical protein
MNSQLPTTGKKHRIGIGNKYSALTHRTTKGVVVEWVITSVSHMEGLWFIQRFSDFLDEQKNLMQWAGVKSRSLGLE